MGSKKLGLVVERSMVHSRNLKKGNGVETQESQDPEKYAIRTEVETTKILLTFCRGSSRYIVFSMGMIKYRLLWKHVEVLPNLS